MQSNKKKNIHYISKKPRKKPETGHPFRSCLVTLLLVGIAGFVGYSGARPFFERAEREMTIDVATPIATEISVATEEETEIWEAETTTPTVATTITAEGTVAVGMRLDESAMESASSLNAALQRAKAQNVSVSYVVLPFKVEGGALLYDSQITSVRSGNAVQGTLTVNDITTLVRSQGLIPVAEINLLQDTIYPQVVKSAACQLEDGERWLDASLADDGKPWLNPVATDTKNYLSAIAGEIAGGGVDQVWLTGVEYPDFSSNDLKLLGEAYSDTKQRSSALVNLVNTVQQADGTVPTYLEISAENFASGKDESFHPKAMHVTGMILCAEDSDTDLFKQAKTFQEKAGDMPFYFSVSADSVLDVLTQTQATSENLPQGIVMTDTK